MIPELRLTGAACLLPGEDRARPADLGLAGGRIASVGAGTGRAVDLSGFLLLPGIVDAHGDGFERHLAPRRGAMTDLGLGLRGLEAELGANGITTAVVAQFWSWEGGMRGPDFALRLLEALASHRGPGTDLRPQLRLETHLVDDFDRVAEAVRRFGVGYLVFNDHLPHDALAGTARPARLTGQALRAGRSPEAHLALLQALHARGDEVPGAVAALAEALTAEGVRLGSHDDRTAAEREAWRGRGVAISEFPETEEAARAAAEAGEPVVLGAPNVLRGGSHRGNASARALIEAGLGTAMASDYHYPALHLAALALWREGISLGAAWGMVSAAPAEMLGLADRGRITEGARADLVVLEPDSGRIGATFAAGRVTWMAGEVAARLIG